LKPNEILTNKSWEQLFAVSLKTRGYKLLMAFAVAIFYTTLYASGDTLVLDNDEQTKVNQNVLYAYFDSLGIIVSVTPDYIDNKLTFGWQIFFKGEMLNESASNYDTRDEAEQAAFKHAYQHTNGKLEYLETDESSDWSRHVDNVETQWGEVYRGQKEKAFPGEEEDFGSEARRDQILADEEMDA